MLLDTNVLSELRKAGDDRLAEFHVELASRRVWIKAAVFLLVVVLAVGVAILLRIR